MNATTTHQVFQTSSSSRWQRFKWGSRFLIFLLAIGITVIIITLWRGNTPAMPRLISAREKQVFLDTSSSWLFSQSKIAKQYGGFRSYINEKEVYKSGAYPIPRRFR